jgi:hypothetical protein
MSTVSEFAVGETDDSKGEIQGPSLRSEAVTKLVSQGSGAVRIGVGLVGWTGQGAGLGVF